MKTRWYRRLLTGLCILALLALGGAGARPLQLAAGGAMDPNGGRWGQGSMIDPDGVAHAQGPMIDPDGRDLAAGVRIDDNGRTEAEGTGIDPHGGLLGARVLI